MTVVKQWVVFDSEETTLATRNLLVNEIWGGGTGRAILTFCTNNNPRQISIVSSRQLESAVIRHANPC